MGSLSQVTEGPLRAAAPRAEEPMPLRPSPAGERTLQAVGEAIEGNDRGGDAGHAGAPASVRAPLAPAVVQVRTLVSLLRPSLAPTHSEGEMPASGAHPSSPTGHAPEARALAAVHPRDHDATGGAPRSIEDREAQASPAPRVPLGSTRPTERGAIARAARPDAAGEHERAPTRAAEVSDVGDGGERAALPGAVVASDPVAAPRPPGATRASPVVGPTAEIARRTVIDQAATAPHALPRVALLARPPMLPGDVRSEQPPPSAGSIPLRGGLLTPPAGSISPPGGLPTPPVGSVSRRGEFPTPPVGSVTSLGSLPTTPAGRITSPGGLPPTPASGVSSPGGLRTPPVVGSSPLRRAPAPPREQRFTPPTVASANADVPNSPTPPRRDTRSPLRPSSPVAAPPRVSFAPRGVALGPRSSHAPSIRNTAPSVSVSIGRVEIRVRGEAGRPAVQPVAPRGHSIDAGFGLED